MLSNSNTENTTHPVCPYCFNVHIKDNLFDQGFHHGEMGCRNCGEAFPVQFLEGDGYTSVKVFDGEFDPDEKVKMIEYGDPGEKALNHLAYSRLIISRQGRYGKKNAGLIEFEWNYFMSRTHKEKLFLWEVYMMERFEAKLKGERNR